MLCPWRIRKGFPSGGQRVTTHQEREEAMLCEGLLLDGGHPNQHDVWLALLVAIGGHRDDARRQCGSVLHDYCRLGCYQRLLPHEVQELALRVHQFRSERVRLQP